MKNFASKISSLFVMALLTGLIALLANSCAYQKKAKLPSDSSRPSNLETDASNLKALTVREEETERAKGRALEKAKDEVILQGVGNHVNPEILAREKDKLLKVFGPEQDDIIKEYKIISEESGRNGIYRVKISAHVREDMIKTLLMKNLYDDRVIVITLEKNFGKTIQRHILEPELNKRIREREYHILDYATVENETVKGLLASIRQGNTESVKKLGIYYLTDIVVVGFPDTVFSQKTKGIYSAYGTGQVKIHQIGSKKEISSYARHNLKGFGSDEEKAGLDALKKLALEIAEESIKELPKNISRGSN